MVGVETTPPLSRERKNWESGHFLGTRIVKQHHLCIKLHNIPHTHWVNVPECTVCNKTWLLTTFQNHLYCLVDLLWFLCWPTPVSHYTVVTAYTSWPTLRHRDTCTCRPVTVTDHTLLRLQLYSVYYSQALTLHSARLLYDTHSVSISHHKSTAAGQWCSVPCIAAWCSKYRSGQVK